jgi:glycosyltransferase involved in cell wall biosynthesis
MRLLIVSYLYAPDRSPRAFRWTALAERWAAAGHDVTVIAAGARATGRSNGVSVHRIPGWLRRTATVGAAGDGAGSRPLLKSVYERTLKRVLWPDYAFDWYLPALRCARRIEAERLVTVSHPFTPHLVGLRLKHRRWLADIGDPFSLLEATPLNNAALYRGLNRRAERRVLAAADAVAVTAESARAAYAAEFPESAGKFAVVPPLLSVPAPGADPLPRTGSHLVFVGTLYRALRNPEPLLALFAELRRRRPDVALHFFGEIHDCGALFAPLPEGVHLHGAVPRATAAAAMRQADALVNIGNATAHQLPSKLVEYVAARRPVLNFAGTPADTSAAFLAGHPALCEARDAETVLRFLDEKRSVPDEWAERFLAPYRLDAVAAAYERLLEMRDPS